MLTVKVSTVHTGAGLGVVTVATVKLDAPYLLRPFETRAVSSVGDVAPVVHHSCEASALLAHEHLCARLQRG
jgi:hypothetical protein